MLYAGTRHSEHNPLRAMPLARPAATVFRSSVTDGLVGELRNALWAVKGYVAVYDKARVALGKANRHNPAWRRASQRDAMRALNVARGDLRRNARVIAELEAKLLALAVPADLWADAASLQEQRDTCAAERPASAKIIRRVQPVSQARAIA